MDTTSKWKTLDIASGNLPILLVKVHVDAAGYGIYITDLSKIWGETLSKEAVVRRAEELRCSIDPSEGDDQFRILLRKVESAVTRETGTSLALDLSTDTEWDLTLALSAPLPSPFPALQWEVHLKALPTQLINAQLVTPLLHRVNHLHDLVHELIAELHEKDRVISKVTDRLEASGNDLTTVFPGVSNIKISRKKSQRDQLARHIKGLADFDEKAWDLQHAMKTTPTSLSSDVLDRILDILSPVTSKPSTETGLEEWWRGLDKMLPAGGERNRAPTASLSPLKAPNSKAGSPGCMSRCRVEDKDNEMQEHVFQRQDTPVHHHLHSPDENASQTSENKDEGLSNFAAPEDESTEDEEDDDGHLDSLPQRPGPAMPHCQVFGTQAQSPTATAEAATSNTVPLLKPPSKLGAIGNERIRSPPTPENSKMKLSAGLPTQPDSKTMISEGTLQAAATYKSQSWSAKANSKLGVIGGKKQASMKFGGTSVPASQTTGDQLNIADASSPRHTTMPPVPTGPSAPIPETSGDATSPRSRAARERDVLEPQDVTSQARADRKREQLQQELECKVKVPVRKKRRF